jgi:two-component system OmpR family response regulator
MKERKMKTPESDVKRILVVEDEPAICALCQRVLTGEGFEVDIAADGKIAQDIIEKQKYQIFLFDIKMPVMTGKDLYQWLEEKHPLLTSKVIFATGSVISGDTQIFMKQTGRPYLPKPFTAAELISIVKETLKTMGN